MKKKSLGSKLGPSSSRPLGLAFYYPKNKLFVVDACRGLLMVEPKGRVATQLVTGAEQIPFKSLKGLDVNQLTGEVYFTEGSTRFSLRYTLLYITTKKVTFNKRFLVIIFFFY